MPLAVVRSYPELYAFGRRFYSMMPFLSSCLLMSTAPSISGSVRNLFGPESVAFHVLHTRDASQQFPTEGDIIQRNRSKITFGKQTSKGVPSIPTFITLEGTSGF